MKRTFVFYACFLIATVGVSAQTVNGKPWSFLYQSADNGILSRTAETSIGSYGKLSISLIYNNKSQEGIFYGLKISSDTASGYLSYSASRAFRESFGTLKALFGQDMRNEQREPSIKAQYITQSRIGISYTIIDGTPAWSFIFNDAVIDLPLDDIPQYYAFFDKAVEVLEKNVEKIQ
jgi:hypothetical protein